LRTLSENLAVIIFKAKLLNSSLLLLLIVMGGPQGSGDVCSDWWMCDQ